MKPHNNFLYNRLKGAMFGTTKNNLFTNMKNAFLILLGSLFLIACTANTLDEIDEANKATNIDEYNVTNIINRLSQNYRNKTKGLKNKQTLQALINEVEAEAMQDTGFLQLLTAAYTTPQAVSIDAIVTNSDSVLNNLNISATAKNYVNDLLSAQTIPHLNTLAQAIIHDTQLTTTEKTMLLEAADLQKQNILGNGNGGDDDKDWDKKKIVGYIQGATQSKANAVLNTVIINVIEKEN